ncbi:hypothetical protein JB92DRAFT_2847048 [Gautieria morchelliformis]|nr:hypothetical protein JB92DRAFT_2847048 [Gautieria morchelliformis]
MVWWDAIMAALRADGWEVQGSAEIDFIRDVDGLSQLMGVKHGTLFIQDMEGKERRS